jgi:hypothetical protein
MGWMTGVWFRVRGEIVLSPKILRPTKPFCPVGTRGKTAEYGDYLSSTLILLVNPYCHSVCSVQQGLISSVAAPQTKTFVMLPMFGILFVATFYGIPLKDESVNFILHLVQAFTESEWQKISHI